VKTAHRPTGKVHSIASWEGRHIVDQIRQGGGNSICWVFHINYESTPTDSWNQSNLEFFQRVTLEFW